MKSEIQDLPVDLIQPGSAQMRRHFDPAALKDLAESIAESGVVQPVVVRSVGDDLVSRYELLAGERRWRASQLAGRHTIPAIVRDDLTDDEAWVLGLIENLQRESLTAMETARGLESLSTHFELTHEETANRVGKSRTYVSNFLRLLNLSQRVQKMVDQGELSMGHARALAVLPTPDQESLAQQTVANGWSVRVLEKRCAASKQNAAAEKPKRRDSDIARLERRIGDWLGATVQLKSSGGKGDIKIKFHSLDELDGILHRWGFKE